MDQRKIQTIDGVRLAYETPIVSILILSTADIIRMSPSEPEIGGEYPEDWK